MPLSLGLTNNNPVKLDTRDRKILGLLTRDARISAARIGRTLNIHRDTVNYKIERLKRLGVIERFSVRLNPKKFGFSRYFILILLNEKDAEAQRTLITHIEDDPHTMSITTYTDKWDLAWELAIETLEELNEILTELSSKHAGTIIDKHIVIALQEYLTPQTPFEKGTRETEAVMTQLNERDVQLLTILERDSRASAVDIARKLDISIDTVIRRIKKLTNGPVQRLSPVLDRGKLGFNEHLIMIRVRYYDKEHQKKIKEYVRQHPAIFFCSRVIGDGQLLLRVAEKQENLHAIIKEMKKFLAEVFQSYDVWNAYARKNITAYPKVMRKEINA